ncbi:unnamed protein product [Phytomonas sp. Hart1]|nr:unnamed protein product [Phytomonas sp. Hart1]|eukprot:CCW68276.1 unnamed protein product [Phytomonas sp. isolate Hart1]
MSTSFESFRLLRVPYSVQEITNHFVEYCLQNHILARGLCRIGYIQRCKPILQLSSESSNAVEKTTSNPTTLLRGLVANKNIPKDTNVVMLPLSACIGPSNVVKCASFFNVFPCEEREKYFYQAASVQNSRVAEKSLIRHNQLFLALYITYLLLVRALKPDALREIPGSYAINYLDFLPRSEGNFAELETCMVITLETVEACRIGQTCLATHFNIPQAEIRPLLVWALCMIYSRMVPIDERGLLEEAFRDTPAAHMFAGTTQALRQISAGTNNANHTSTDSNNDNSGPASGSALVTEPISFLCPVIDMCNHGDKENVAVMVPDAAPRRVVCLRTLRNVAQGEELIMTYSQSPAELRTIWGMSQVLV